MRCSKFSKFMSMDQPPTGQRTNHDLWKSLFHSMQECKRQGLDMRVLKVTSHQADSLAEHVWLGLTVEVQRTWEVLEKELVVRYRACQELHRLFIAIGRKAITYKHANCLERCNQVGGGRFPPQKWSSQVFTSSQKHGKRSTYHGTCIPSHWRVGTRSYNSWGRRTVVVDKLPTISHFQSFTGELGFLYDRDTKQWANLDRHVAVQGFDFLRAAAWFQAFLKCFARFTGSQYTVRPQMAWGNLFRCWQRCIHIPASPSIFHRINTLFSARGATLVSSVHESFRDFDTFCLDDS